MPKTTKITLLGDARPSEPVTIGERLRRWRGTQGLTQIDLGKKLDVDVSTLRKYELGVNEPGARFLTKAHSSGLNVNWVLSGEGTMSKPRESALLSGEPAEQMLTLADALAVLFQTDPAKFSLLVRGFTARAQEAARLAHLERENAAKSQSTPSEPSSEPGPSLGAGAASALLPTDSEFDDLIRKARHPLEGK